MRIIYFYKLGNFFYKKKIPLLPKIFDLLTRIFCNSVVYSSTKIGRNCNFAYGGIAVVVHPKAIIGNNVTISQCVTIGGRSGHKDLPTIGNDVYIGAGAKVLGPIKIGNNVIIGANAVVISNIPDNSVVAGVPAKIIRTIKE